MNTQRVDTPRVAAECRFGLLEVAEGRGSQIEKNETQTETLRICPAAQRGLDNGPIFLCHQA